MTDPFEIVRVHYTAVVALEKGATLDILHLECKISDELRSSAQCLVGLAKIEIEKPAEEAT